MLTAGRFPDAVREFDAALAIDPLRADRVYYAVRARLTLGDVTGATQFLSKATELKPADAWAWNAVAVAYAGLGDAKKASDAVARALSIDAANELFRRNRECLTTGCRLSH